MKAISLIFLLLLQIRVNSQDLKTVDFEIKFDSAKSSLEKGKLYLRYSLLNNSNNKIRIPSNCTFISENQLADIRYIVERFNDSLNAYKQELLSLTLPAIRDLSTQFLNPGDKVVESCQIHCVFPSRGTYRIRLIYNISKYNPELNNLISNWVDFEIPNTILY